MRSDTVEEPTVVAHDDGAAGERVQTFLEGTDRIYVNIIGRLIQKKDIALVFEGESKVQTVPFSSGKHAAELFLVSSAEIEPRHP